MRSKVFLDLPTSTADLSKRFPENTLTHGYEQRGSAENEERSSLAEKRFFDAGGAQILSRVGSYFHHLTVPRPL